MNQQKRTAAEVAEKKIAEAIRMDNKDEDEIRDSSGAIEGAPTKTKISNTSRQTNEKPIAGAAAKAKLLREGSNLQTSEMGKLNKKEEKADEVEKSQTAEVKGSKKSVQNEVLYFYICRVSYQPITILLKMYHVEHKQKDAEQQSDEKDPEEVTHEKHVAAGKKGAATRWSKKAKSQVR